MEEKETRLSRNHKRWVRTILREHTQMQKLTSPYSFRTSKRQRAFCITLRVTGSSTRGSCKILLNPDERRRGNDRTCHPLDPGSNPGLASLFKNVREERNCVDSPPNRRESARELASRGVDARWRPERSHPGVFSKIRHLL